MELVEAEIHSKANISIAKQVCCAFPCFFFFSPRIHFELRGSTSCTPAAIVGVVKVHAPVEHFMSKWVPYSASRGSCPRVSPLPYPLIMFYNARNDFCSWRFLRFLSAVACGF